MFHITSKLADFLLFVFFPLVHVAIVLCCVPLQSVTFDPFMYLSVPIPVRLEKMVMVVMLPRICRRDLAASNRTGARDDATGASISALRMVFIVESAR